MLTTKNIALLINETMLKDFNYFKISIKITIIKISIKITKTQSQSKKKDERFLEDECFVHWTSFEYKSSLSPAEPRSENRLGSR